MSAYATTNSGANAATNSSSNTKAAVKFFHHKRGLQNHHDNGYGCVTNSEYPKAYAAEQMCRFNASGTLKFVEFATEKWFDTVKIDGEEYSGNVSGTVEVKSELLWSSDFWLEGLGWKLVRSLQVLNLCDAVFVCTSANGHLFASTGSLCGGPQ